MSDFTHLHVHSHYSIFQGLPKPKELVAAAAHIGYKALALTDYGLCAGFPGFVVACKDASIKPILGFEAYIVPDRMVKEKGERRYNVLLTAKNKVGYANLIDISSAGFMEQYYGKPRIDLKYLAEHSEGLICSTANISGHVPTKLQLNEEDKALAAMGWYRDVFGDDFYVEIMFHEYTKKATQDMEKSVMERLLKLSKSMGIKAFCSNDVRYCARTDAPFFEAYMCCAPRSRPLKDPDRFSMNSDEFYLKTPEEMADYFNQDLMSTTAEIVEKVDADILGTGADYLPSFDVPEGQTENSFLRSLIYDGMKSKELFDKPEYRERAEREMKVFEACNYVKYFLVLWDFVNAAKSAGIVVGPGRGSAAGSLCLYALNITKLDPLEHGLLFERFLSVAVERKVEAADFGLDGGVKPDGKSLDPQKMLELCSSASDFDRNSFIAEGQQMRRLGVVDQFMDIAGADCGTGDENGCNSWMAYWSGMTSKKPDGPLNIAEKLVATRVSPPDVDLDFDYHRRDEVYRYLDNKYGAAYTCNIGTFTTIGPRSALKYLAKAFDLGRDYDPKTKDRFDSLRIGSELADMVFDSPKIDFNEAFARVPALEERMRSYGNDFFNACLSIEGRNSAMGQHPAGYVVSKTQIHELVPLRTKNDMIVTQFDMNEVEELGLLKYDLLALRTLTVISDTVKLIKERHGDDIDPDALDFKDQNVFDILNKGITNGVFQYESGGMTELLQNIHVDDFEDMVAAAAIFRPGPLAAKVNETYCDVKHGRMAIEYDHPIMEEALKNTYGCLIYQEQIMELSKVMAGFTSSQADKLRKACGKKLHSLMLEIRPKFIKGCVDNNIDERTAVKVWAKIEEFGSYGFNKSHSACYAFIAYQTAYLKRYYPLEFMCCLLTSVVGKPDKLPKYMREARDVFKFPLYRPDVNLSGIDFEIATGESALLVPFTYLKGVGRTPAQTIIENKPYEHFRDFVEKTHDKDINKTVVEALIDAGSFSAWEPDCAKLKIMYQGLIKEFKSRKVKKERFSSGTVPLLSYRYSETEKGK